MNIPMTYGAQQATAQNLRTSTQVFNVPNALGAAFVVRATPGRKGMVICNPETQAIIFLKFGGPVQLVGGTYDGIQLLPNEKRVMDYVTPLEALYLMSNQTGVQVIIEETVQS